MKSGKRKVQVTLDTRSIEAAIAEVKGRKRYVERRLTEICEKLADRAVEICRANLMAEGAYHDGDLYDSIKAKVTCENKKFRVFLKANSKHALYVEFGSGIAGKASPHPQAGKWNGGDYKEEGWWTAADGKDMAKMYGWTPIVLPNGDTIYYVKEGQPAKPFMYNTIQQLRKEFPEIVKEAFKH